MNDGPVLWSKFGPENGGFVRGIFDHNTPAVGDQTRSLKFAASNVFFSRKRSIAVRKAESQQSASIAAVWRRGRFTRKQTFTSAQVDGSNDKKLLPTGQHSANVSAIAFSVTAGTRWLNA